MPGSKDDYFQTPGIVWIAIVPAGVTLLSLAFLKPEWVPYEMLGPIGTFMLYLVQNYPTLLAGAFYFTWISHAIEAVYVNKLCEAKQLSDDVKMKWMIQTFIFGMFSLTLLKAYKPKKRS